MTAQWKRCTRCGRLKPTGDFQERSDRPSGYASWCAECAAEARREAERMIRAARSEQRMLHRTHEELIGEGERRTAEIASGRRCGR